MAGIVLATRLLPTADDAFRIQALDALGDSFLNRLLVPLRVYRPLVTTSQQSPAINDALHTKLERQVASASLGISVLAAVAHIDTVVKRPSYMQCWDTLAKVMDVLTCVDVMGVVSNFSTPLCSHRQVAEAGSALRVAYANANMAPPPAAQEEDAAVVGDALTCLTAMVHAGCVEDAAALQTVCRCLNSRVCGREGDDTVCGWGERVDVVGCGGCGGEYHCICVRIVRHCVFV